MLLDSSGSRPGNCVCPVWLLVGKSDYQLDDSIDTLNVCSIRAAHHVMPNMDAFLVAQTRSSGFRGNLYCQPASNGVIQETQGLCHCLFFFALRWNHAQRDSGLSTKYSAAGPPDLVQCWIHYQLEHK